MLYEPSQQRYNQQATHHSATPGKADVAQLVEQPIRNRQVSGSSPLVGSTSLASFIDLLHILQRMSLVNHIGYVLSTGFCLLPLDPYRTPAHNRERSAQGATGFSASTQNSDPILPSRRSQDPSHRRQAAPSMGAGWPSSFE